MSFFPNGQLFVTGDRNGVLRLWNAASRSEVATMRPPSGETRALSMSRDGQIVATAHEDGTLRLWNLETGVLFLTLSRDRRCSYYKAAALSPNGRILAAAPGNCEDCPDDKGIELWNTSTGQLVRTLTDDKGDQDVVSLAFSPDGKILASGSYDERSTAVLWDVETGDRLHAVRD